MDASDVRVMIVEDDELEREALAALLAGRGYRISQASNGLLYCPLMNFQRRSCSHRWSKLFFANRWNWTLF